MDRVQRTQETYFHFYKPGLAQLPLLWSHAQTGRVQWFTHPLLFFQHSFKRGSQTTCEAQHRSQSVVQLNVPFMSGHCWASSSKSTQLMWLLGLKKETTDGSQFTLSNPRCTNLGNQPWPMTSGVFLRFPVISLLENLKTNIAGD